MPRRPQTPTPTTALGAALVSRRGQAAGRDVADAIGIDQGMLSRLERGERAPSINTALILARWLGWSVEEVHQAASRPLDEAQNPTEPASPPAPPLHTLALRLPDGRILQRWRQLGEAAYVRDGAGAFAVVVDAIAARCAIAGLDYVDEEPGRTAEERRDLLDAWLVERGACALAS